MHTDGPESNEYTMLLRRIAAGSEQALIEFYQAFHSSVYAFALKLLKDPVDAAEILNVVMLEVWRCAKEPTINNLAIICLIQA